MACSESAYGSSKGEGSSSGGSDYGGRSCVGGDIVAVTGVSAVSSDGDVAEVVVG